MFFSEFEINNKREFIGLKKPTERVQIYVVLLGVYKLKDKKLLEEDGNILAKMKKLLLQFV